MGSEMCIRDSIYLVVECTTTSAPNSKGLWKYGEANVLSITVKIFRFFVTSEQAEMSCSRTIGLVGDSSQTSLVDFFMRFFKSETLLPSK